MLVQSALAVLLACFSSLAVAQTSEAYLTDIAPAAKSNWRVEGAIQAHSVAGNGSPWIGVAGAYKLVDWGSLGLRGFVPLARTVDESTYAIQLFGRARLTSTRYTDFFTEADFAQNFFNFLPFTSYGLAVGSLSRVTSDLSVGFLGGVELAGVVIDSVGLERRNSFFIYPKVALLADFAF